MSYTRILLTCNADILFFCPQAMPPPDLNAKPPYAAMTAGLGGTPTVHTDVPITAVFLVLFILGAIAHMVIFQINQRRGHKFIMSGMMFGFCMARTVSCIMRIVWATRPFNVRVAIAAQIFVAAGVVLLFVTNLIFAQRIIRAAHPHSGWHPLMSLFFKAIYVIIVISLVMLITSVVQSPYTRNANTHRIDRDIQLYGQTLFAIVSFLPIPLVVLGLIIPRKIRVEKFGSGRFRSKIYILLSATFLLCLGATFRCGTNYLTPRPRDNPAWYHSKACFYVFNFVVEILVIFLYIFIRVDRRFWVPNNSHMRGDYSRSRPGQSKSSDSKNESPGRLSNILSEEEVFDEQPSPKIKTENHAKDEEAAVGTAA